MTIVASSNAYGEITEPGTLTIQRRLPGPIERVWAYLTKSDLRRQWLAAGAMEMKVGASCELVWRNAELNDPPSPTPPGHSEEHRMEVRITELDPPRKLAITWGSTGGVTFELQPRGDDVLLTVTHHRVTDRDILRKVSAGWHMHLDVLAARIAGQQPQPFWDGWSKLQKDYERRIPG
jgi:uncharacterized protein YndB with AHSA1/START domain